jgi:tetratricopeptide (TPR) repeat protein
VGYGDQLGSRFSYSKAGRVRLAQLSVFCFVLVFSAGSFILASEASVSELRQKLAGLTRDVMNVEALQQAVDVCEEILKLKEHDPETLAAYSRVCWSLGNHQKEKRQQKEWFKKGQDLGQELRDLFPKEAAGYYWYAVNYGEFIDRSSIFAKIGAKKVIVGNMEKVIQLNEKYDSGGAYIILGRINFIAPGGSYSKAIEYYEKAIAMGPRRTTGYLYLAELYLHEHIFGKAEKLLQKVLTMEVDPRYAIEGKQDLEAAKRLWKKLDRKEDRFPEQEGLTGR